MLIFFLCTFFVNLLVALIQWTLLQYSFDRKLSSAVDRINSYWEVKLAQFDLNISCS